MMIMYRAVSITLMFPFIHSHFERTTWHEVAALVVCVTGHPLSILVVVEINDDDLDGLFDNGDPQSTLEKRTIIRHIVCTFSNVM